MKVTFVGGGNMASALIGGLLQGVVNAAELAVIEPDEARAAQLAATFGVRAAFSADLMDDADVIVLAVKPQQLRAVAQGLAERLRPGQLVVSIAAGIRLADLSRWLGGHQRLVRVMPNTPALVGAGVSGVYAPEVIDAAGREQVTAILAATGRVVWVDSEDRIDAITAISGSGPAYVFYFIEALQQAAEQLGFDADSARSLALGTFDGAVKLALTSPDSPAVLRAKVTSKGGTTERALHIMQEAALPEIIARAAAGAATRSQELAVMLGQDA